MQQQDRQLSYGKIKLEAESLKAGVIAILADMLDEKTPRHLLPMMAYKRWLLGIAQSKIAHVPRDPHYSRSGPVFLQNILKRVSSFRSLKAWHAPQASFNTL